MKKLILMATLGLIACGPSKEVKEVLRLRAEVRAANDAWAGEKASLMMNRDYASEQNLDAATKRLHQAEDESSMYCVDHIEACIEAKKLEKKQSE
jgi:hypothetical protein